MSANAEYSYLWDGTEPGWVVLEHTRDEAEVLVAFGVDGPTLADIKALRSVSAALKKMPAADVLKQLRGLGSLSLGLRQSRAARRLQMHCQSMGLRVSALPAQDVQRSLINTLTKRFLLIEDDQACRAVVADALANGLRIVHSKN